MAARHEMLEKDRIADEKGCQEPGSVLAVEEGLERVARRRRSEELGKGAGFLVDPRDHLAALAAEEPPRGPYRLGRLRGKRAGVSERGALHLLGRHYLVDEAGLKRARRVILLPHDEELESAVIADHARAKEARRGLRRQPEIGEGRREDRPFAGDDEVAMEQESRADADGEPVDGGDDRLVDGGERLQEADRACTPDAGIGKGAQLADDMAGGEDAGGTGGQDHANARIALGDGDSIGRHFAHLGGARIAGLRPVEADRLDAIGDFNRDMFLHSRPKPPRYPASLNTAAAARRSAAAPPVTVAAKLAVSSIMLSAKKRASATHFSSSAPASAPLAR